jgi:hypothetical protein
MYKSPAVEHEITFEFALPKTVSVETEYLPVASPN